MRRESELASGRLYERVRELIARDYRERLTLAAAAARLGSSPRQLQRAYARAGETSFGEDLRAHRLRVAAQLLEEQPSLAVASVARLVGYSHETHLIAAFGQRYGQSPARFRALAAQRRVAPAGTPETSSTAPS